MAAVTVTPSAAAPSRLIDLIRALPGYANTRLVCAWLTVRADDGNGANYVYQGGSDVSATNYGVKLATGDSRTWPSAGQGNTVDMGDKFLLASAAATKADVSWEYF